MVSVYIKDQFTESTKTGVNLKLSEVFGIGNTTNKEGL